PGKFSELDKKVLEEIKNTPQKVANAIEKYHFREAQKEMMNLARLGNKYLTDEEPWKLIKTDEERVKTIMYISLQISAALIPLAQPFIPFTSEKLKSILNLSEQFYWNDPAEKDLLKPGHQINKAELLFSKIEDKEIEHQLEKLEKIKKENMPVEISPQKEEIAFDDFTKLDLRVGEI